MVNMADSFCLIFVPFVEFTIWSLVYNVNSRGNFSMKKFMPRRARQISNTLTTGYNGAGTTNDFNATQVTGWSSLSPYYSNNFLYKYQIYANLYETSWEARKIIDIPIDDAMRKPTIIEGLPPAVEKRIKNAWEAYSIDRQL